MDLIIDGGTVVTISPKGTVRNGTVVVEDNCIIEVGKSRELKHRYSGYEKIDTK